MRLATQSVTSPEQSIRLKKSKRGTRLQRWKITTLSVLLLILLFAPFGLAPSALSILSLSLVYGLFTYGLDLSWGRVGLISVGHAAFFGIGAYSVSIGAQFGTPFSVAAIMGVSLAALIALGLGAVTLSAPESVGVPLLILLTLGMSQLLERIATSVPDITGGSNGITMPTMNLVSGYYIVLLVCVAVVALTYRFLIVSRRGFFQDASLINPVRAEHLGINLKSTRLIAFMVSGTIAAGAGSLFAPLVGIVTPTALGLALSTSVLTWLAVGGKGSVFGPFIGAGILTIGTQTLSGTWQSWYIFATAALFITIVLFAPSGLVGLIVRLLGKRKSTLQIPAQVRPMKKPISHELSANKQLLEVANLQVSLGGTPIVKSVSLTVIPGECVCLIGPNGAGKSTLLGAIAGSIESTDGEIIFQNESITRAPIYRRARMGMGRMFQVAQIFGEYSVGDNLRAAATMAGKADDADKYKDETPANQLSMAERRHLELDMVMLGPPDLLLLDEPAAGLSRSETSTLAARIRKIAAEQNCGLLIVEHDMELVRQLADRVIVLADGRIIAEGSMDEVVAHKEVRAAYLGAE